jgi:hypothetical protein
MQRPVRIVQAARHGYIQRAHFLEALQQLSGAVHQAHELSTRAMATPDAVGGDAYRARQ